MELKWVAKWKKVVGFVKDLVGGLWILMRRLLVSEEKEGVPYGGGHWEVKGLVGGSEKRMASMRERERERLWEVNEYKSSIHFKVLIRERDLGKGLRNNSEKV